MNIEQDIKLDFKDVLIRPKRSTLNSRQEVDITRTFKFKHTKRTWTGVPIIAANMDTVGTFKMYKALSEQGLLTALHKHYPVTEVVTHFKEKQPSSDDFPLPTHGTSVKGLYSSRGLYTNSATSFSFYSMGITDNDYQKFNEVMSLAIDVEGPKPRTKSAAAVQHPVQMVCVDVANGYTQRFGQFIKQLRRDYPHLIIMAGNVVTREMTEELILAGADIVKVGIGPGSVCTTRKMTGVGYPQLSAIIECADAAHGLGGLVCADGGCTNPGDIAKAFGAGADFVMLGGMLAGHDESGGDLIEEGGKQYKRFYGMSSDTAMQIHSGGVASYRASEGKTVQIPYRGPVAVKIQDILGGLRSTCTYVGASRLKEVSKCTTFIRVTQQINEVFGKSE